MDFNFPFKPYPIQQSFMQNLYQIYANKKIGIFESPTGTGKSLSLLCATLKFVKDYEEKTQNDLEKLIDNLNREILSCIEKSDDWIEEQYQLIQKKQQLVEHQTKLDKIKAYNQKIRDTRNKIREKERTIKVRQKVLDHKDNDLVPQEDEDEEEDDDLLLADLNSDSEEELNDDEPNDYKPLQVYFCSRTHSQLSQLVGELKSTVYSEDSRSVTLASRQNYCINKSVQNLQNTTLINERCLELQKSKSKSTKTDDNKQATKLQKLTNNSCPFYKKNLESLRNLSLTKVMDIEELVNVGVQEKSCPYYSSRSVVGDSQIIFVPYQILFNQTTRQQCGIDLKDSIVIVDEAHNLMDTIMQMHTATVTMLQLKLVHTQMLNYKMKYMKRFGAKNLLKFNQLIFIAKQLMKLTESSEKSSKSFDLHEVLNDTGIYNINLIDILKFCEQTKFAQKIHGYSKIYDKLQKEQEVADNLRKNPTKILLMELQENSKAVKLEELENVPEIPNENYANVIRNFIQFVECLTQLHPGGRILVNPDAKATKSTLKYLLLDSSSPFESIIKNCRSIILAGGTMKPTDEITNQLFKTCKERVEIHSFGHVVPGDSILPIALSRGCSGKEFLFTHVNKESDVMINEAAITIRNMCSLVPGGVVCFFTSYDNLNKFITFINDKKIIDSIQQKKDVYVEPRNSLQSEKVLESYARSIKQKRGAIIFSVIGGKLSEGMNFSDDLGRCVIVVGLPFPNKTNPELVEKMKYITKNISQVAASEYYENLCMKAVNQSIGRAIRHIGDYAIVLLMDSRYHRQNIIQKLPDWIKEHLVIAHIYGKAHCQVANFFKNHDK